jgi:hypothetical protein
MPSDALVPVSPDQQTAAHPLASSSRRAGVVAGAALAALSFPVMILIADGKLPAFSLLLGSSLLASIPMALRGGLGAQVLARAFWWQGLVMGSLFGALITIESGDKTEGFIACAALIAGTLGAIVSAGRAGLAQHSARFAPAAFRGGLMLSMVLALADTQALLLYGTIMLEESYDWLVQSAPFFASAATMMAALWGLWNMKMWGFLLNIAANVVIAGLAVTGVFKLPGLLAAGLATTAVIQLLIPIPIIRAMIPTRRCLSAD